MKSGLNFRYTETLGDIFFQIIFCSDMKKERQLLSQRSGFESDLLFLDKHLARENYSKSDEYDDGVRDFHVIIFARKSRNMMPHDKPQSQICQIDHFAPPSRFCKRADPRNSEKPLFWLKDDFSTIDILV